MDVEPILEKSIFCAIVGAGMTGVTLADKLLSTGTLTRDEFVIFDKNADFGGVWYSNKYPGAACDIASHAYVVRSYLNPGWTQKFSEGLEIQQYYAKFAERYALRQNTLFKTVVHEARWNQNTFTWEILVEDMHTGRKTKWLAKVLFDNGGYFHKPKIADIPGREHFKGEQWHTAEWPEGADLTGKRVAVIGTGPSAAQVAPAIQPIVDKLYMFQRSCGHVLPRNNHKIPEWKKFLYRWIPGLLWIYHVSFFVMFDLGKSMWMVGTRKNQDLHEACISFLEREVRDPVVRDKLRPENDFGCKRVLFLDTWYRMYNEPNVELVVERPVRITEHGIVSQIPQALDSTDLASESVGSDKLVGNVQITTAATEVEREIDVLVWGTGFDMGSHGTHFQIYGQDGMNLADWWGLDPKAYWGVAAANFPNLFFTVGPNSTNYWANLTTIVEIQVNYHCKLLRHIKKESKNGHVGYALSPNPDVQAEYNKWLKDNQHSLGLPSFLAPACANYNRTAAGTTPMYTHVGIWPYYRKMLWPKLSEFTEIRQTKAPKK